jgi:hypothetical protein
VGKHGSHGSEVLFEPIIEGQQAKIAVRMISPAKKLQG